MTACDSTSGTVLLLDSGHRPASPALMYDDLRAAAEAELVNARGADVWSSLGYSMSASWGLPKLLWLLERADRLGPDVMLAHQADLINRRLTGERLATDSSHALKTGYDLLADRWPTEVMDELGVPDAILPEVVRSGERLGEVGSDGAEATGLPAGTPVIAGMTDGCAAQIGAGALEPGQWNSALGTTLVPVVLPDRSEPALGMAILAGAGGRTVAEVAREMVRLGDTIEPRASHAERFREPYLRLIDELEHRGWLDPELASHGHQRAGR